MSIRIGIGLDIFSNRIDPEAQSIYNRIIAIPNGFSNLSRLNYFVKGLKAIYGTLSNVPVCYDAHWIGGVLGSGVGATAGQACARLCSLTVAGDAIQATASAQPLLLAHNGASTDNYFYAGPGNDVVGAYCKTNTNISPQINTDFTFEFNFSNFISRGLLGGVPNSSTNGWSLAITPTNVLKLYRRNAGTFSNIDSTTTITTTGNRWVKVVRSGNDYSFWQKADGGTYAQVGTTITDATAMNTYTLPIQIGDGFNPNYAGIGCNILRAKFYNDATQTTLISDFNPATYNASTSQTQWTSTTGEVWTINKSSTYGSLKGYLVDRNIVMGNGTSFFMTQQATVVAQPYTNYFTGAVIAPNNSNFFIDCGTSWGAGNRGSIIERTMGTTIELYAGAPASVPVLISNTMNLYACLFNGISSGIKKNNNSFVASSSNSGTDTLKGITLMVRFGLDSTSFLNGVFTTVIISGANDTESTRTATYNFIRSLNNNAF